MSDSPGKPLSSLWRAGKRIAAGSLVLITLVLAAVMLRSYFSQDAVNIRGGKKSVSIVVRRGVTFVIARQLSDRVEPRLRFATGEPTPGGPDSEYRMRARRGTGPFTTIDIVFDPPRGLFGFDAGHRSYPTDPSPGPIVLGVSWVTFPLAAPLIILALIGALWLRRRGRARRRRAPGTCRVCGYDLCATPERCPECGTEAPTNPAYPQSPPR